MVFALVLFAAVHAGRGRHNVDPVGKVIDLLKDLKNKVQDEGIAEKGTYDTFACFCKSETIAKAASIESGETTKATLEADLKALGADAEELNFEINTLTEDLGRSQAELKKAQEIRNKDNAAYLTLNADLEKAVSSLEAAIASISGSKSFAQTSEAVRQSLVIADALGETPANKVVQAFLQGTGPEEGYDFHSDGIVGTLNELLTKFKAQDSKADEEESAEQSAFATSETQKKASITTTQNTLSTRSTELSTTQSTDATKTGLNTEATANLNDDNTYLKDLTGQCEAKAREWDQRSTLRGQEIDALSQALQIITGDVKSGHKGSGHGGRSMLVQEQEPSQDEAPSTLSTDEYTDVVFVQTAQVHKHGESALRVKAVTMVQKQAELLKSVDLSLLAMRMAADPFAKVKTLIQELLERLLKESADEANQKGWCDTSLAKANTDRDFRQGDLDDLSSELNSMTASKVSLEETVHKLEREVHELERAHSQATRIRNQEKSENKDTLDNASAGLTALQEAITGLKEFYKGAAKGSVSLVQTGGSPVDADLAGAGAGHLGAYQGSQTEAAGIMGMLATIESDFERTIKQTSEAEGKASADYTKFDRETKASVAAKTTGIARANSDILETTGDLKAAYFSLQQNQKLLDAAMKTLETLRPQCVDTAMSPEERVARREAEVAALKKAVCVLDEEDNEIDECAGWGGKLFLQK